MDRRGVENNNSTSFLDNDERQNYFQGQNLYFHASTFNTPTSSPTFVSTPHTISSFSSSPVFPDTPPNNQTLGQHGLNSDRFNSCDITYQMAAQQEQKEYELFLYQKQKQKQYKQQQHKQERFNVQNSCSNEISKSLQFLAMCSHNLNEIEPSPPSPVDAVMQDFASNGFHTEDRVVFERMPQSTSTAANGRFFGTNTNNNINNSAFNNTNTCGVGLSNTNININSSCKNNNNNNYNCYNHNNNFNNNNNIYNNNYNINNRINSNNKNNNCNDQLNMNLNAVQNNFFRALQMQPDLYFAAAATAALSFNLEENAYTKKMQKRNNNNTKNPPAKHCVFCENNNEPESVVKSHTVRDVRNRVLCPKLRTYICPICKASGDEAHTVKYCPQKPIVTMEDAIRIQSFRLAKDNYSKLLKQMK